MLKSKKSKIVSSIILVVVLFVVLPLILRPAGGGSATVPTDGTLMAKVERGSISDTVSANGSVEAAKSLVLKATTAGKVVKLNFAEGAAVKAGDVIAEIESTDLNNSYVQAVENLKIAQNKVKQSVANYEIQPEQNTSVLQQAMASLAAAKAKLADLQAGTKPQEITQAKIAIEKAKATWDSTKSDLKRMQDLYKEKIITKQQLESYELKEVSARTDLDTAKAKLELLQEGATREELASAKAQIKQAEADVTAARANMAQTSVKKEDLNTAQTQLRQAEETLRNTQKQIGDLKIRAAFDGILTSVPVVEGEQVAANGEIATLATNALHVNVDVDESDIARVKVGQKVEIKLDAYTDKTLIGEVKKIASAGEVDSDNVVTYPVEIVVNAEDLAKLKIGMSADVEIVTERKDGVLILATSMLSEQNGEKCVYINNGKGIVPVRVTIGLSNINYTEITGGLQEGQQVMTASSTDTTTSEKKNNRAPGPF